jgi:hypothetical protein
MCQRKDSEGNRNRHVRLRRAKDELVESMRSQNYRAVDTDSPSVFANTSARARHVQDSFDDKPSNESLLISLLP